MFCHKFDPIEIKCPESGYFRKKLWKNRFIWLLVGLFLGTGWGQYWRHLQVDRDYEELLSKYRGRLKVYQEKWVPLKPEATNKKPGDQKFEIKPGKKNQ